MLVGKLFWGIHRFHLQRFSVQKYTFHLALVFYSLSRVKQLVQRCYKGAINRSKQSDDPTHLKDTVEHLLSTCQFVTIN